MASAPASCTPLQGWLSAAVGSGLAVASALVVGPATGAGPALLGDAAGRLPASLWHDAFTAAALREGQSLAASTAVGFPTGVDPARVAGGNAAAILAAPFVWALGYPEFWNPFVLAALFTNGLAAGWVARKLGAGWVGSGVAAAGFALSPPILTAVAAGAQDEFIAAPMVLALVAALRLAADPRRMGLLLLVSSVAAWFLWQPDATVAWLGALCACAAAALRAEAGSGAQKGWALVAVAGAIGLVGAHRADPASPTWHAVGQMPDLMSGGTRALLRFREAEEHSINLSKAIGFAAHPAEVATSAACLGLTITWMWRGTRARFALPLVALATLVLAAGRWLSPAWDLSSGWLPLPLGLLEAGLPRLSDVAHPERYAAQASLAVVLMGALLLDSAAARLGATSGRVALAAGGGLLLGLPAHLGPVLPLPRWPWNVPWWVARVAEGGPGAVALLPLGWTEVGAVWQPLHGHPVVGGPGEPELRAGDAGLALAGNAALAPLLGVEGADWEESTARAMAAAGLGWVVVDTWAIEALQQRSTLDDQTWFLDDLTDAVELGLGPPVETVDGLRLYRVPQ